MQWQPFVAEDMTCALQLLGSVNAAPYWSPGYPEFIMIMRELLISNYLICYLTSMAAPSFHLIGQAFALSGDNTMFRDTVRSVLLVLNETWRRASELSLEIFFHACMLVACSGLPVFLQTDVMLHSLKFQVLAFHTQCASTQSYRLSRSLVRL